MEPDTGTPIGQAVAITYASRSQEEGKLTIAVSGFNLQNQISPTVVGVSAVEGQLKWDDALLEVDARGIGNFLGGNDGGGPCVTNLPEPPGTEVFCVARKDRERVTGSGELYLVRLKPRAGVTSGTTRIALEPFLANQGASEAATFMTSLKLSPYIPGPRGNVIENAYGATITIRPGR